MDSYNLNIHEGVTYNGQFGEMQCSFPTRQHLQNISTDPLFKLTQLIAASKNIPALIKYLLDNGFLRQSFTSYQMPLSVNLFNISVLSNLVLQNNAILPNSSQNTGLNMPFDNHAISNACVSNDIKGGELDLALINQVVSNCSLLSILSELNAISNRQHGTIQPSINNININRKRQTPDFDDYNVISRKRAKSHVVKEISGDSLYMVHNNANLGVKDSENVFDQLRIFNKAWNANNIADPHIDHTYRVHNSVLQNERSVYFEQQTVSCLSIFDDEIKKLDNDVCYICRRIFELEARYSVCQDYIMCCQINDELNKLKLQENLCKNKYASLCDARHEIFRLYIDTKNSDSINFNAEFVSLQELAINKRNRDMLDKFRDYY